MESLTREINIEYFLKIMRNPILNKILNLIKKIFFDSENYYLTKEKPLLLDNNEYKLNTERWN